MHTPLHILLSSRNANYVWCDAHQCKMQSLLERETGILRWQPTYLKCLKNKYTQINRVIELR